MTSIRRFPPVAAGVLALLLAGCTGASEDSDGMPEPDAGATNGSDSGADSNDGDADDTDDTDDSDADQGDGDADDDGDAGDDDDAQGDSQYADGDYQADGSYTSPGGRETIEVNLSLADGVITAVSVDNPATTNPNSLRYQGDFIAGIADEVVGVAIEDVEVDRVGGSSLTSGGFNEALDDIMAQAQS